MITNKPFKKILILGSGGLRIGQAGEFDYSGSQALKALKEAGVKTVLVNPNIATIQTDSQMADEVYLQPLTLEVVTSIIEKERPDALLLNVGGQTALNLGLALDEAGVLSKYNVLSLGTSISSIRQTEDRDLFKNELKKIHVKTPHSAAVTSVQDAENAANQIGYPVMLRAGFSLGGLGSGKVNTQAELIQYAEQSFAGSPQILIEEYLLGWKEFEYEIIRDRAGNTLTICNMENMDPTGIHTGESIVVAPAQTLSNDEHQKLRRIAIDVANHFNIIGECNIQFAVNPRDGDYRVIEVNARLSRSSALASKATGYPLAFVATKLALGSLLHEITNSVTQKTCAFFEPALDYIVVKIPRWDMQKLRRAGREIGTEMKSVGEVMGIGRSFAESLQKAVGMLNIGAHCLADYPFDIENVKREIAYPTDRRLFALYRFFLAGGEVPEAHQLSQIDPWFLYQIAEIAELERKLKDVVRHPTVTLASAVIPAQARVTALLRCAKELGFSDHALARIFNVSEVTLRQHRKKAGIVPVAKQIDTLAGEFAAQTNYLYLTYHGTMNDVAPMEQKPIFVIGSGPYAIGSSVEFDWCAVNASRSLRQLGQRSVLINSNPETVSTDYDESDRLYFEQLTFERIQDIADIEEPSGMIVCVGGQIANNLAAPLAAAGYVLLGTSAENIDRAEDRKKFSTLLNKLSIDQPLWQEITSAENAKKFALEVGYPIVVRPSYILSGAAMNIADDDASLQQHLSLAVAISPVHPVVISKFINEAKELEVDGVARNGLIICEAISEHVENAGVHSGDATLVLPPQTLYLATIRRAKAMTREIVRALNITGPFNIQFIAKNNRLQVIECNVRASRSLPFVSKVTNHNFIDIAIKAMLGIKDTRSYETLELDYVGVKAPQFSYQRLKGADPVPHIEMASTGEVAALGENLYDAFWRAWLASEQFISNKRLLVSIADAYKAKLLPALQQLEALGWRIYSTEGTHSFLFKNGVASYFVYKASERHEPNTQTVIAKHAVDLIINIPRNDIPHERTDGFQIRRLAIDHHIPLITNAQKAQVLLQCLIELKAVSLPVRSYREIVTEAHLHE